MSKEKSTFYVLNQLRDLAKEAERLEELIPPISILDDYFSLVIDTALKIKSCTSIKNVENIEFPPDIKTVIGGKRVIKIIDADVTETQRAHLHAEKHVPTSEVSADMKAEKNKSSPKVIAKETSIYTPENREYEEKSSSASLCKSNQKPQLLPSIVRLPQTKILNGPVKIISENSSGSSVRLTETPVMNRTFNKLANNTVILDSTSANKTNQKLNIEEEIRVTRSASKQKLEHNKDSSTPILTKSGSKRKSTASKSRSNKKQKTESVTKSATKSKQPRIKKKHVPTSEVSADMKAEENKTSFNVIAKETSIYTLENREYEEKSSSASLCRSNQKPQLLPAIVRMPETKILNGPVKIISENSSGSSVRLMETPLMNRTFNKLADNAVMLDSTSANKTNQKSNIEEEIIVTRSASKQKLERNKDSSPPILIKSGSKRKSTASKSRSNKKQKTESVTKSATKSKQPRIKKNPSKPTPVVLLNKMKPVIIPTMKQSTSMVPSKEKQIMEEIQKKEEKANENRKKVLAERQLKAEESKKKRNEKMEKTLQKRLQMEKEKEERLEKKDVEKKPQTDASKESVKKAKPATKSTRTKELIDQHMKENNCVLASKQNETKADSLYKTPDRKSRDSETYDLTPAPDSSTYDFSDDEDKPSGKPIPVWAQGVQLRLALTHQYYDPPNVDKLFGDYIEPPDLSEIFGVHKKIYLKRTSSAVWHSPLGRN